MEISLRQCLGERKEISRQSQSWTLCVLQLVVLLHLLIIIIFCLINFMDFTKRKRRLEPDKNLYIFSFRLSSRVRLTLRQGRDSPFLNLPSVEMLRQVSEQELEILTRKVEKLVIQMNISSSLVISAFIMTTNVSFKSSRCFWVDEDVECDFFPVPASFIMIAAEPTENVCGKNDEKSDEI